MTIFQWILSLKPAIPMSIENPCSAMSNGELKRIINQGGVLINGEKFDANEKMDFEVFSLVFFPKSLKRKTTII